MRALEGLSLVSRKRRRDVPPVAECRLEASGMRLLRVAERLDAWLEDAPQSPIELGQAYAAVSVKALAVAWGSTMLRWLAERPRSLSELDQLVPAFGYRKLERIVRDVVEAGLIERVSSKRRLSLYGVTDWGRSTAGPLAAAMRWERHEIARWSAPVGPIEAEGVLLLGSPLAELPAEASGTCALLIDAEGPERDCLSGAVVRVVDGRVVSWRTVGTVDFEVVELRADCWVRGETAAWLGAHASAAGSPLRAGGCAELADQMLAALREVGWPRPRVRAGEFDEPL
jgi:DNA-binding HxlR family transcriptional regulator